MTGGIMNEMTGMRILVVGGSSGIGLESGLQAARAGANVAFAARRTELLDEAVAECGESTIALQCDVRDPQHCSDAVEKAAKHFGGLDVILYSAGTSPLKRMGDATRDIWAEVLETNVIGAALVARAALPHLQASNGRLILLGSSSVGRPYPGLVPYTTSKAALHELARGLRGEFPWLRLTTFIVGPTMTGFANSWDPELFGELHARWSVEGYAAGAALTVEEMSAQVIRVMNSGARIDEITVMPDELPPS